MKCRVCKCTHNQPCEPPCGWEMPGLCTSCAGVIRALGGWYEGAHKASIAALLREFKAYLEDPFVQVSRQARGARR